MTTKASTRRGARDRKKEAFWRGLVEGRSVSGLSVRAWCLKHSLRESSFYWWRRQLARRDAEVFSPVARKPAPAFVPVRVTADRSADDAFDSSAVNGPLSWIEIVLPARRRVRLIGPVDRQALTEVLAVLSSAKFIDAEAAVC